MTKSRVLKSFATAAAVLALSAGAAFADAEKSQKLLEDGKARIAAGETKAGVIQLRNAVKADPQNAEARLTLGQALLMTGDLTSAEKELRAANEAEPSDLAEMALAQTLFNLQRLDEAIEVLSVDAADGRARRAKALMRADMKLRLLQYDGAIEEVETVLQTEPVNTQANFVGARVEIARGRIAAAQEYLDTIIANDLSFANAWFLKAQLAVQAQDYPVAVEAMEKAIEITPDNSNYIMYFAETLVRSGDYDEAQTVIDGLKQSHPEDPRTAYLQMLSYIAQRDFEKADLYLPQVGDNLRDTPNGLVLIGLTKFRTDQFAQAEAVLKDHVKQNPTDPGGVQLLAATQIQLDKAETAVETLDAILANDPNNISALQLKASAQTRAGDFDGAARTYTAITQLGGASDAQNAQSILSLIGVDASASDQDILEIDPKRKKIVEALDFLRADQLDKALATAEALAAESPEDPVVLNVLGSVYLAREEEDKAIAPLEKALEIDPSFLAAIANLSRLDVREGDLASVEVRLEQALEAAPENVEIGLRYASLLVQQGREDEAIAFLEQKRRVLKQSVPIRGAMAQIYLRKGDTQSLRNIARELVGLGVGGDNRALLAGAASFETAGEHGEAVKAFEIALERAPASTQVAEALARNHILAEDSEKAIAVLKDFVLTKHTTGPMLSALVDLFNETEDLAEAEAFAADLAERNKSDADLFRAALKFTAGETDEAINLVDAAFAADPSQRFALQRFNYRMRADKAEEAQTILADWVDDNPQDVDAKVILSGSYIEDGELARAEQLMSAALVIEPYNTVLLNNLAWTRHELDRPGALELARKAQRQAPFEPNINDTLGWILVEKGELDEGVAFLREAVDAAPQNGDIVYHLAFALSQKNETDEAKTLLTRILSGNEEFSKREDAEKLLESLG